MNQNKYLEKIAKIELYKPPQKKVDPELEAKNQRIGKIGLAAGGAGIVAGQVGNIPIYHHMVAKKPTISNSVLNKVKEHIAKTTDTAFSIEDAGIPHKYRDGYEMANRASGGAYYSPAKRLGAKKNLLYIDNRINPDALIHEAGHAVDFNKGSPMVKNLKFKAGVAGNLAHRGTLTGISGLAGAQMLRGEKTRDYAWTVPLAASSPTIRSEFMANKHGLNLLKKQGVPAKGRLGFLGLAAKNMIGYGSAPVATSAALALGNRAIKKSEAAKAAKANKN